MIRTIYFTSTEIKQELWFEASAGYTSRKIYRRHMISSVKREMCNIKQHNETSVADENRRSSEKSRLPLLSAKLSTRIGFGSFISSTESLLKGSEVICDERLKRSAHQWQVLLARIQCLGIKGRWKRGNRLLEGRQTFRTAVTFSITPWRVDVMKKKVFLQCNVARRVTCLGGVSTVNHFGTIRDTRRNEREDWT